MFIPKKPLSAIVVAAVILAGAWIALRATGKETANLTPLAAKVPIAAATASRTDVPVYLSGLGTVQAFNMVTVRVQVDGQLRQVLFKEGQEVKTGDLLAQIDPRSLQAALDQASAKKAQDQALLANARNDLQRYTTLVEKNYVARQQLDTSKAQVAQLEAAVQGDDAAIENARVSLGYTTIRAPIDGRVGIRMVDAGNIVHASESTGLVVITQMHPISVLFTLPEENLLKVLRAEGPLGVTVLSRDGTAQLDQGILQLVDNQIDQTTGTVKLKATMPNEKGLLWPGQFVNARLKVGDEKNALTIPAAAVQRGQQGSYCFVVRSDDTVEPRPVKLGEVAEGKAVVLSGVEEGERVVTAGHYRLTQGTRVEIRADAAPSAGAPERK